MIMINIHVHVHVHDWNHSEVVLCKMFKNSDFRWSFPSSVFRFPFLSEPNLVR